MSSRHRVHARSTGVAPGQNPASRSTISLDRRRSPLTGGLLGLLVLALVTSACGGSGSSNTPPTTGTTGGTQTPPQLSVKDDDPQTYVASSSVGFGEGPAPHISAAVRNAAAAAGCSIRADASAVGIHLSTSDLVNLHTDDPDYSTQTLPPTNGMHNPIWANWGIYTTAIPYRFEVHNLEHGGIAIHLGSAVPKPLTKQLYALWASSPPFMLLTPTTGGDVPASGITTTSWQRALLCPTTSTKTITAIRTFRDAYRGRSREAVPSANAGTTANDLPTPTIGEPAAG